MKEIRNPEEFHVWQFFLPRMPYLQHIFIIMISAVIGENTVKIALTILIVIEDPSMSNLFPARPLCHYRRLPSIFPLETVRYRSKVIHYFKFDERSSFFVK